MSVNITVIVRRSFSSFSMQVGSSRARSSSLVMSDRCSVILLHPRVSHLKTMPLLHRSLLRFGLDGDGHVRVGVFPESEEFRLRRFISKSLLISSSDRRLRFKTP